MISIGSRPRSWERSHRWSAVFQSHQGMEILYRCGIACSRIGTGLVLVSNLIHQSGIISIILVVLVYAIATGLVMSWLPASHRKTESNLVNAT